MVSKHLKVRRGGVALAGLVTAGIITVFAFTLVRAGTPAAAPRTVRVLPGDTLWGLASEHGPAGRDTRRLIYELERSNGLGGRTLHPGMELVLPADWR